MHRIFEKLLLIVAPRVRSLLLYPMDVGVLAIVEQAGRVVLVRHSYKSGWMLPGGAVGRGEPPANAVIRELEEEIGLSQSAPPQLVGVYVRRLFWVTNLILLYRVREAVFAFRPSWEVRALKLVDPADPPPDASPATQRRLKELQGEAPQAADW